MADVNISVEKMSKNGLTATYTGSLNTVDDFYVRNSGKMFLHFKKSGVGDCDVTLDTPRTVSDLTIEDPVVTVPASTGDVFIGPFAPGLFNDVSGDLHFNIDDAVGLTVAAVEL